MINGPESTFVGDPVTFSAAGSQPGTASITQYQWQSGDGNNTVSGADPQYGRALFRRNHEPGTRLSGEFVDGQQLHDLWQHTNFNDGRWAVDFLRGSGRDPTPAPAGTGRLATQFTDIKTPGYDGDRAFLLPVTIHLSLQMMDLWRHHASHQVQ